MLARPQRLHTDKDYSRLFAKGRVFHGRGLSVKAMLNGKTITKVGFVVSTKVSKRANVRNLIKRRLREVVRKHYDDLHKGVDMAIIAKTESKDMDFASLRDSLIGVLIKAGLLPKK